MQHRRDELDDSEKQKEPSECRASKKLASDYNVDKQHFLRVITKLMKLAIRLF